MTTRKQKETAQAGKQCAIPKMIESTDRKKSNRKTTFLQGLLALTKPKSYTEKHKLAVKREDLKGAILLPSQDVFAQMRGGQQ